MSLETKNQNVCEHGDHPAPEGKRFCSYACETCEHNSFGKMSGCDGLCQQIMKAERRVTGASGADFKMIGSKLQLQQPTAAADYPADLVIGEHVFTESQPALNRPVKHVMPAGSVGEIIGVHRWRLAGCEVPVVNVVVAWPNGTASIISAPRKA